METLSAQMVSYTHFRVDCSKGVCYELQDYFSFFSEGYQYDKRYKNKVWDGKIKLFSLVTYQLPAGLFQELRNFCASRNYKLKIQNHDRYGYPGQREKIDKQDYADFIKKYADPLPFSLRPYQLLSVYHALTYRRCVLRSPTASGKSLMVYLLAMWHVEHSNRPILIICPRQSLVKQIKSDFEEYGLPDSDWVHLIFADKKNKISAAQKIKQSEGKRIIVSTRQSLSKVDRKWYEKFGMIIGDEAHEFDGKSLQKTMNSLKETPYRIGLTGSLKKSKAHRFVLEGVFGPVKIVTTTKELQNKGYISQSKVYIHALDYPLEERKTVMKAKKIKNRWYPMEYHSEISWILGHSRRTEYICDLAESLEGNTILLFRYVESHGKILYDNLSNRMDNVYYVHGGVDVDDREAVRKIVETKKKSIIVASEGVFSMGINIKNLHNVILSNPMKTPVRLLQSIGRVLRLSEDGSPAKIIDIVDDLRYNGKPNYAFKHANERQKIYREEKHPMELIKVKL